VNTREVYLVGLGYFLGRLEELPERFLHIDIEQGPNPLLEQYRERYQFPLLLGDIESYKVQHDRPYEHFNIYLGNRVELEDIRWTSYPSQRKSHERPTVLDYNTDRPADSYKPAVKSARSIRKHKAKRRAKKQARKNNW
jgi:hypothetical protein